MTINQSKPTLILKFAVYISFHCSCDDVQVGFVAKVFIVHDIVPFPVFLLKSLNILACLQHICKWNIPLCF